MMSASKGSGIHQSKRSGWSGNSGGRNNNIPETNRTRIQEPDRTVIPPDGERHGDIGHTQGSSHGVRRHTIRKDRGKSTMNLLDVERSEFYKAIKGVAGSTRDIDAIRHTDFLFD